MPLTVFIDYHNVWIMVSLAWTKLASHTTNFLVFCLFATYRQCYEFYRHGGVDYVSLFLGTPRYGTSTKSENPPTN